MPHYFQPNSPGELSFPEEIEIMEIAKKAGLQLGGNGYKFFGDYVTKGLYYYKTGEFAGMAFYGLYGSEAANNAPVALPKYRL